MRASDGFRDVVRVGSDGRQLMLAAQLSDEEVHMSRIRMIAVAALFAGATLPVAAYGFRGGGPGPEGPGGGPGCGGPHGPGRGGVIEQLVNPCRAGCHQSAHGCFASAESTAVSCIQSACPDAVTAAQTACAAGRHTQACRDAIHALHDCGATCLSTLESAANACHDSVDTCVNACGGGNGE
jgi:hypothetical protein